MSEYEVLTTPETLPNWVRIRKNFIDPLRNALLFERQFGERGAKTVEQLIQKYDFVEWTPRHSPRPIVMSRKHLWTLDYLPIALPPNWEFIGQPAPDQFAFKRPSDDSAIIWSAGDEHEDGKRWLHMSMTCERDRRVPTYSELAEAKNWVFGAEMRAIQVFAPKSQHVNIHPHCLHLWACADDDGLPNFGQRGTI